LEARFRERVVIHVLLIGFCFANRKQRVGEQQRVARQSRDQVTVDRIEQTNTGERFHAAKRGFVDVNNPNATVAVNELLHGTCAASV